MPSSSSITTAVLLACFVLSLTAFIVAALAKARGSRAQPSRSPDKPPETAGLPQAPPPFAEDGPVLATAGAGGLASASPPPPLPAGKVPVWLYRPLDWLWMGFIVLLFGTLSLANASLAGGQAPVAISAAGLLQSIGLQLFLATLTVLVVAWRLNPVDWLGLRWPAWRWALLIGPGAVLAMWLFSALLYLSGYLRLMQRLGVEDTQETVKLLQQNNDPAVLGLMALAAVVVAPLCEEVVFRGYLYPAAKRFAGPWVAGAASALVFAAAHGALAPLLPLFAFGVLLVLAYEFTGSLWAPIAMHFCFNGATVLIQLAVRLSGYQIPDSL
jgi:membrane protease YdiL (CAAX protease family)